MLCQSRSVVQVYAFLSWVCTSDRYIDKPTHVCPRPWAGVKVLGRSSCYRGRDVLCSRAWFFTILSGTSSRAGGDPTTSINYDPPGTRLLVGSIKRVNEGKMPPYSWKCFQGRSVHHKVYHYIFTRAEIAPPRWRKLIILFESGMSNLIDLLKLHVYHPSRNQIFMMFTEHEMVQSSGSAGVFSC